MGTKASPASKKVFAERCSQHQRRYLQRAVLKEDTGYLDKTSTHIDEVANNCTSNNVYNDIFIIQDGDRRPHTLGEEVNAQHHSNQYCKTR